jgi:hypothetical protein
MAIGTLIGGAPKALGWAALGLGATRLAVSPLVIAAVVVAGVALTVVWLLWRRPRSSPAHAQPAAGVAEPVDLYLDSPVDPLHVACADSCPQPQGQWEGDEGDDLVRDSRG